MHDHSRTKTIKGPVIEIARFSGYKKTLRAFLESTRGNMAVG